MVIAHMSGGFGNQLYSFAFGYSLAKNRGEEFWIDTAIQDASWFFRNPDILKLNIEYDKRITYKIGRTIPDRAVFNKLRFRKAIGWRTKKIMEKDIASEQEWFSYCKSQKGNIYVQGNWSMESLFLPVKSDILRMYTFREPLKGEAEKLADEIQSISNTVGVHYRRGDYVNIGISMKPSYYRNAMDKMAAMIKEPVFYCFSEDLDWVKEQFKDYPYDIRYPKYESDDKGIDDFRLLSLCNHQITANSSYSWWAAYLNKNDNKEIICPCDWDGGWSLAMYPEEWIKLPFEKYPKEPILVR
ncbi:MAG: alpha-1,2-fucosyltransferase [Lachnospiraceae bacterium]|nr:alpha-1,2-fucosyltransferase [Lachnospiraceae bacterium]